VRCQISGTALHRTLALSRARRCDERSLCDERSREGEERRAAALAQKESSRALRPDERFATEGIGRPERATTSSEGRRLVPTHNVGARGTRSADGPFAAEAATRGVDGSAAAIGVTRSPGRAREAGCFCRNRATHSTRPDC